MATKQSARRIYGAGSNKESPSGLHRATIWIPGLRGRTTFEIGEPAKSWLNTSLSPSHSEPFSRDAL